MLKVLFLVIIVLIVTACGKSKEEIIEDAIEKADILLTKGECDLAITILEGVGRQSKNYNYLRVLAASYACKAGYSESVLFGTDLPNLSSTSIWGSISTFSMSTKMLTADSSKFQYMIKAIEIILYAGGGIPSTTEPTVAERSVFISGGELADLHTQALYMLIAALGMYVYHYGDADNGLKAQRSANNHCFLNYNQNTGLDIGGNLGDVIDALDPSNACSGQPDSGHPDLTPTASNVGRLCDGVFLFNNFRVVLTEVLNHLGSSVDDLDSLKTVKTALDVQRGLLLVAQDDADDVDTVLSKSNCVTENTADVQYLELYFLYYFDFDVMFY